MNVTTRGYCTRSDSPGEAGSPITFVASTTNVARDGLIIDADAWQLDNFRKNPVVLWAHDYGGFNSPRPPIGRATNLRIEDGGLLADITFDIGDPFAADIDRKFREGFLNTVSVGWDTQEMEQTKNPDVYGRVTKAELLDISAVPVPGDPNALMERQKRAYRDLGAELLQLAEPDADPDPKPDAKPTSTARASWDETAAAMVALYRPYAQRPDAERKADHQRWAREYARLRKTPPEFLPQHELDSLSVDDVRGLFLEGEPELHARVFAEMESRAGAVLSQRNRDDLSKAVSLVQGVIERAAKDAAQDEADAEDERTAAALTELHKLFNPGAH